MAERTLKTAISVFKTPGTYTPAADPENPFELNGVFDKVHKSIDPETGVEIDSHQSSFGVNVSDLPAEPADGDMLTVAGLNYEIIETQEDGETGRKLILSRRA